MKKLISLLLALILCAAFAAVACADAEPEDSPEWVSALKQAQDAEQLFVVAGVGQTTAYVSMHEKDENGNWKLIITTPGFIGKYGLGKTKEGDGMTPVGTFSFNAAFGIAEDPGCAIPYQQVTEDDYWSGDQRDGYGYNEMVSIRDLPDLNTDDSEHIVEYAQEYQYCLNISYNEACTPGLGSAIFLHCFGAIKPYTGGCVALPQAQMLAVMQNVRPDCVVVVDSLKNISPETWNKLGLGTSEGMTEEVSLEFEGSAFFTARELDRAVEVIREEFDTWSGCELHSIRYAGDESCSEENLEWLNSLVNGSSFTRCAEFISDFHSPKESVGAWEPDTEYTNWQWWLGETTEGEWELVSWGY